MSAGAGRGCAWRSAMCSRRLYWLTALIVLAADRATKWAAEQWLQSQPSVPVLGDLFRLTFVRNTGAAFSLLAGPDGPSWRIALFAGVAVVTVTILTVWVWRNAELPAVEKFSFGLIAGGALGNLIDRLATGRVVDFLDMGLGTLRWPVYNIADSAVTVGVVLYLLSSLRGAGKREGRPGAAAKPDWHRDSPPPG